MKELVQNIKCPQCSGQLTLQGGQQILSITCHYCGSVLDTHNNFKVLSKFATTKFSIFPFKIGSKCTWNGVGFILIGIVQYVQKDEWGSYPWVEGLLYSPTHGYLWLIYENGHFVIGRECKTRASNEPKSLSQVEIFKDYLDVDGTSYRIFEIGTAEITFVLGELTWVAQPRDKIEYLDAIAPPHLYCIEKSKSEQEYFKGEYVSGPDVFAAFGLEDKSQPEGVYACQPLKVSPTVEGISFAGKLYALITFFLILWFAAHYSGHTIYSESLPLKPDPGWTENNPNIAETSYKFSANETSNLMTFKIYAPLSDAWAAFDVGIVDAAGNEITGFFPDISYYSGVEGGESWVEGSRSTTSYFQLPAPGEYAFNISYEGGTGETEGGLGALDVSVAISENVKTTRYLLACFGIMFIFGLSRWLHKYQFERNRWKDYYEDLEDEDDD